MARKWYSYCADCGKMNHTKSTECSRCGYGDEDTLFLVGQTENIGDPQYTSDGERGVYVRGGE